MSALFAHVRQKISQADEALLNVEDLAELASELRDVREAIKTLRMIDDEISERMIPQIGKETVEVEGIGFLQAKKGSQRKAWDHEGLLRVVVARGRDERRIDHETGEALESEADAILRAVVACAGIRDWKVTGLKERGIDVDDFCEKTWGPTKVIGI